MRVSFVLFLIVCLSCGCGHLIRQVHATNYGTGEKAVVLIHGWTCDETVWRAQVAPLQEVYRVITVDLPGHGQSGPPAGKFTQDLCARTVHAVLAKARVKKAVLVGHSMGGLVIWRFAKLYPNETAALVAVDAPFKWIPTPFFEEQAKQLGGPDGPVFRENWINRTFSSATTSSMRKEIKDMMLRVPERTAVEALRSLSDPALGSDGPVTQQVLAIGPYSDNMGDELSLRRLFLHLELQRVAGVGHFLMMENPVEFNRVLLDSSGELSSKPFRSKTEYSVSSRPWSMERSNFVLGATTELERIACPL